MSSVLVNCMVMKGNLTPVRREMLQCKLGGVGDTDVVIPPCSMQFVLSFARWRGISRMAPGEKGSRAREFLLGLRCEKQGRKKKAEVYRGNWKAKKTASKKLMTKSAACLHWFVCCCFLLFNVSQSRCLLFIEFVVLESAFLFMMILHISGTNIHLIEMLFKENMFPIKGPGPFQQVCQRPIGHSSNQVSQILGNKRRATLVWEHPFTVIKARLIQRHYWKFDEWICIFMLFQKSDFSALLFFCCT